MKNSGSVLTKQQKQATVQKWVAWILKQRVQAAKAKEPRPESERV
jgi:ABC-type Fe3+ transport system substrate-binding protein